MTIDSSLDREAQALELSNGKESATTTRLLARTLGWGELFILTPLHSFWVLYKSTPFVAESPASAAVAAVPMGAIVVIGLAACWPRIRVALVCVERLLHFTAAVCMAAVLFYVATRDPLNPTFPITWPLCFWSIAVSFVMMANVAMHARSLSERQDTLSQSWNGWITGVGVGVATWAAIVWIASGTAWLPYFLTVSLAFHAIMAIGSCNAQRIDTNHSKNHRQPYPFEGTSAFLEILFVTTLMLGALLQFTFVCHMVGTAELKYFQFVDLVATPWFVFGAILVSLAFRFRATIITHTAAVGILLLVEKTETPFSVSMDSLVLGYCVPVLFLASTRVKTLAYSIAAVVCAFTWLYGSLTFTLAGLIIVHGVSLGFIGDLISMVRTTAIVLYAMWLTVMVARFWWTRHNTEQVASGSSDTKNQPNGRIVSRLTRRLTYSAIWLVTLVSVSGLIATTMWPAIWFRQSAQIAVGEPTGLCHAGYSRSDREYADLDKLGIKSIRADFSWSRIQPDAETWNLGHFDTYVNKATEHGVNIIAILNYDNNAVEESTEGSKPGRYIAPKDVPLFLEYVRRTVEHYKDRVHAWEIWNEPDIDRFWLGTREEFYELARKTVEAIRQVHPKAQIIGPAMTSPLGVLSAKGIEGLHSWGAMNDVDHPTMHMYLPDPRGYYNEFLRVQNAAAKHGHEGSVWITEIGDPDGGVYPWRLSNDIQAEHVIKAHAVATSMGIEKLIWYCYRDADIGSQRKNSNNSEGFFGLIKNSGQWKPSAHAYSLFATNCSNTTIRRDLVKLSGGLAARQLRTVLYRRDNGESTLVLWFEPTLRPDAHARVTIDLGQIERPAVLHEITSDYTRELVDDFVDVTEKPLVITYQSPTSEASVMLHADGSPADEMWLLSVFGLVLWAGINVIRRTPE